VNNNNRRALVLCSRRAGEVLAVTARGALSRQGVADARAYVAGEFRRADARALVVDFSAVLYPVGDNGVEQELLAPAGGTIPAPIAYLVPAHSYEWMRGVAWRMAERGWIRGVFLDPAAALAWAADRREYWTHRPGLVRRASAVG
jgi:hypothetical protein